MHCSALKNSNFSNILFSQFELHLTWRTIKKTPVLHARFLRLTNSIAPIWLFELCMKFFSCCRFQSNQKHKFNANIFFRSLSFECNTREMQVTATDGDKDRPQNIVYFLTGQGIDPDNPANSKFDINRTTGEIFVLKVSNFFFFCLVNLTFIRP